MIKSPQTIQVSRNGVVQKATVTWWWTEDMLWMVTVASAAFDTVEAQANDAFEALCLVRGELEPHGWRLGVAGAQSAVWPSGMARDQGGGLRAYRIRSGGLVDTFEPVDPATVTTVAKQRAEADRLYEEIRRKAQKS